MINALTFVGWTLLNGSLMFFGVLNIRNPKTNEIETLVYPIVNDYNENCSFPGNDTNKDGPSPISIIEVTTKPSITTEPTNPEDDDKFETTAESITTAPNTTTALQTTAAPTNKYGECGFRNSKGRPRASTERAKREEDAYETGVAEMRILGGTQTLDGEWPWMTLLYETENGILDGFICAATLIDTRWLVTAAHCIRTQNAKLYSANFGQHIISKSSSFEFTRGIEEIIVHPDYNTITLNSDIALLKLDEEVIYSEFIRPACLAAPDTASWDTNRYKCTVLGWGDTGDGQLSDILLQLNVEVLIPSHCVDLTMLDGGKDYSHGYVVEGDPKICAGGIQGQDTCGGDSGGPLICLDMTTKSYFLHGVTSYGTHPCGQPAKPGVYTKVSSFTDWIQESI